MWVSQSGSAREHMHSSFNRFRSPVLPSAVEAWRGFALTDRRSRHGRFPFWRWFWGVVWVNELKGALSGVKKVVQSRSPFRWLWVVMVFAEIYQLSRLWCAWSERLPAFFPTLAVRAGCTQVPS